MAARPTCTAQLPNVHTKTAIGCLLRGPLITGQSARARQRDLTRRAVACSQYPCYVISVYTTAIDIDGITAGFIVPSGPGSCQEIGFLDLPVAEEVTHDGHLSCSTCVPVLSASIIFPLPCRYRRDECRARFFRRRPGRLGQARTLYSCATVLGWCCLRLVHRDRRPACRPSARSRSSRLLSCRWPGRAEWSPCSRRKCPWMDQGW